MEPTSPSKKQSAPRKIEIRNDHFGFVNIEAWLNIIRSYKALHPRHEVTILYEGETLQNKISLFKLERPVNMDGFFLVVSADDQDLVHVPKLHRLLVEGGSPKCDKFIQRELHQILDLF